jgi:hypothetical protein
MTIHYLPPSSIHLEESAWEAFRKFQIKSSEVMYLFSKLLNVVCPILFLAHHIYDTYTCACISTVRVYYWGFRK